MGLAGGLNSALRRVPAWPLYIIGALPPLWWLWLGFTGGLGVDPTKALEHHLGEIALQGLILGLAITPLRRLTGVSLIRYRRAVGLVSFFYVVAHLLVWLVLDVRIPAQIWADIVKRPYITIGMAAFALLIPLALTSSNRAIRALGARWRQLHRLVYPAAILGALHYIMLKKTVELEPLLYMGAILVLLALRWQPRRRARG